MNPTPQQLAAAVRKAEGKKPCDFKELDRWAQQKWVSATRYLVESMEEQK